MALTDGVTRPPLTALTGARFFAAFGVVLAHYQYAVSASLPAWTAKAGFGGAGVSFFFVLSGFILTYNYADQFATGLARPPVLKYFRSRFARIYPIYVVTMIVTTIVVFLLRRHPATVISFDLGNAPALSISWLANLFMLQPFYPKAWLQFPWNGPAWSVGCEVFFYALFPPFVWAIFRTGTSKRQAAALLGVVFLLQLLAHEFIVRHFVAGTTGLEYTDAKLIIERFPLFRVGEFFIGCCAGYLFLARARVTRPDLLLGLAVAGYVAVEGARFLARDPEFPRLVLLGPVFAAAIYALARGDTILSSLLESRTMILLGDSSYSLYLVHWAPLLILLDGYGRGYAPMWVTLVTMLCCVLVSIACLIMIERPARNWLRGRPTTGQDILRTARL